MHKLLAFLILGIAFAGVVLMISVTYLFESPTGIALYIAAASAYFVIVFSIWAIVIRKRFADMLK